MIVRTASRIRAACHAQLNSELPVFDTLAITSPWTQLVTLPPGGTVPGLLLFLVTVGKNFNAVLS